MINPKTDPLAIDTAQLPQVARKIIKALGWQRGIEFLNDHGGTVIYIRKQDDDQFGLSDQELTALHHELKDNLTMTRGYLSVPKVDKIMLQIRNKNILSDNRHPNVVAKRFKVTSRWVQMLRAEHKLKQADQQDLFV